MAPLGAELARKMSSLSEGYGSEDGLQERGNTVELHKQIFTNRNMDLGEVSCYGFDMDYTLCEYISPQFDSLAFGLAADWLVDEKGYSKDILDIEYNPRFPVRGLWYDRQLGNLLKTDQFSRILECQHGTRLLGEEEVASLYPGRVQKKDESRVFVMNTCFNLAETYLVAALTDFLDRQEDVEKTVTGWVLSDGAGLTFAAMFGDIRAAVDDIHLTSLKLKRAVIADTARYVKKDARLVTVLERILQSGRQTFLLTNSDWWFTEHIMTFLLGANWMSYFNLVGVDACKPRFFTCGSPLQLVSSLAPGGPKVPLEAPPPGPRVYSGGSQGQICQLLGAPEEEVMYVGDHLWADVIRCRKNCQWKTLLIVPELAQELAVTTAQPLVLDDLRRLEESLSLTDFDDGEVRTRLRQLTQTINASFGASGSLFRSGGQLSYFGSQVSSWSEVYTGSVCNLAEYSLGHRFTGPPARLPHEELVARQGSKVELEEEGGARRQLVEAGGARCQLVEAEGARCWGELDGGREEERGQGGRRTLA